MLRATVRTSSDNAVILASAIRPDNTDDITTTVEDGKITTIITRDTIGGLQATLDDYITNLETATRVIETVDGRGKTERDENETNTNTDYETTPNET